VSVVQASVTVDAPVDDVWNVVSDPNNLPMWDHHVVRVNGVPPGGIRQGTRYDVVLRFMGARATVPATVVELQPRRYSKVRLGGLIDAIVESWVEPVDHGRTRLRHRVDYRFRGGPLGALAARAVNILGAPILLRRGVREQQRQAEAVARKRRRDQAS